MCAPVPAFGIAKLRHDAPYGQGVTRAAANLVATERAPQSACANEGADKPSSGLGDPLSETTEWGLCGALPGEPVPDSRHRVDVRRLLRVRLDFATQPVDVRVDRAGLDLDLVSPDAAEQLSAAHDLTGA